MDQQSSNGLIVLKLWKDGFTINDSEIRMYDEVENRDFLDAIKRGEIPAEIRQQVQGAEVRLDMEDHRHETYVPSKSKVKVFSGKGHMLGRYVRDSSRSIITNLILQLISNPISVFSNFYFCNITISVRRQLPLA